MATDTELIIEVLLIILLPPLAIWYHDKACSINVCLNICLMLLFFFPAIIHAVWYCLMRNK